MAVLVRRLMAKKLKMTIQVKLVQEATCSPELLLLNF